MDKTRELLPGQSEQYYGNDDFHRIEVRVSESGQVTVARQTSWGGIWQDEWLLAPNKDRFVLLNGAGVVILKVNPAETTETSKQLA